MPLEIRHISTAESRAAVGGRQDGLGLSFDIPKVFIEKRQYMQSDEFINDPHNKKMFELGEELAKTRELIGKNIKTFNGIYGKVLAQGINGFARMKKYLDANYGMNFSDWPTFETPAEKKYYHIKAIEIKSLVRKAKKQLGLK